MNRFYIDRSELNSRQNIAHIRGLEAVNHISKALRLKVGDMLEVCAGLDDNYIAKIEQIEKGQVVVGLQEKLPCSELTVQIDLFQGIVKGHKWDFLIQKSVEAGVHDIYPIQMSRSVSIIKPSAAAKKQQRWQKIAQQAAMQSKRSYLTQVQSVHSLERAIELMSQYDLVLIAYEDEHTVYLKKCERAIQNAQKIAIWIGPEGGIAAQEIVALKTVGTVVSLGKRIYRTESAAMALLAQLSYIIEQ